MNDHWRLFIALPLLRKLCETLSRIGRDTIDSRYRLSWVRPEAIHLTLKFLGDTDVVRLDELQAALTEVATAHTACNMITGAPGVFKNRGVPRVLWWGLGGAVPQVVELAAAVEAALAELDFPRSDKPFKPHITLARVKQGAAGMEARFLEACLPVETTVPVTTLQLIRSTLHPQGARYRILSSHPLKVLPE